MLLVTSSMPCLTRCIAHEKFPIMSKHLERQDEHAIKEDAFCKC